MDDGTAPVDYLYKVSDDDQLAASAMMAQQGLDIDAREQMDNYMAPRLGDLAEYMKRKAGLLSTNEREALSQGREHLVALLTELDHLLFAVPAPASTQNPPELVSATRPMPSSTQHGSKRKLARASLLPPSPEKASKRHQSYAH
ncbi:hypothetical protein C8R44DRAFT_755090 [Mycena epipterygia]|nr:hypothetical protein C8R44DRAFT_755090 [Mycena epipterygia]